MLWRNFAASDPKFAERGIALARHFIAANADADARQLLKTLVADHPGSGVPARWLAFLDAERLDRIVLLEQPSDRGDVLGQGARRAGIWLETMHPVWVQIAHFDAIESHEETAGLMRELTIPGVASVLESGTTDRGAPYFAISNSGKSLGQALGETAGLELAPTLRVCHEAVGIFNALAAVGVQLADSHLDRFTLERSGALQLTDLTGARRVDPDIHGGFHFDLARSMCNEILNRARRHIVPAAVRSVVSDSKNCAELARGLARSRG
jgi:hypothetical protein